MYKKSLAKWEHQQETFIMLSTFGATKEVGGGRGGTPLLWLEMALFSKKALHNIKKHS